MAFFRGFRGCESCGGVGDRVRDEVAVEVVDVLVDGVVDGMADEVFDEVEVNEVVDVVGNKADGDRMGSSIASLSDGMVSCDVDNSRMISSMRDITIHGSNTTHKHTRKSVIHHRIFRH